MYSMNELLFVSLVELHISVVKDVQF